MNHPAHKWGRGPMALAFLPLVLLLALVSGCGSNDKPHAMSSTEHNDADVTFATEMIQHHAQALAMVNLTVDRKLTPSFEALATRIREAQAPEIETMTDWLDEWGEKIPETVNDHMNHDMGTMPEGTEDMPGMMSADEMKQLEDAPDGDFETMWLEMMIRHHKGAIEMAKAEQSDGKYKPAVDLANSIASSQSDEIEEMKGMIASQ